MSFVQVIVDPDLPVSPVGSVILLEVADIGVDFREDVGRVVGETDFTATNGFHRRRAALHLVREEAAVLALAAVVVVQGGLAI
jgi:hypothetical protein